MVVIRDTRRRHTLNPYTDICSVCGLGSAGQLYTPLCPGPRNVSDQPSKLVGADKLPIVMDVDPGNSISTTSINAVSLANSQKITVVFNFNGTWVTAEPGSNSLDVMAQWYTDYTERQQVLLGGRPSSVREVPKPAPKPAAKSQPLDYMLTPKRKFRPES